MGIQITTSTPPSKITVLGSGTATITGDGNPQDIGNFSTLGDIGNGTITVEVTKYLTQGAGTNRLGLSGTATSSPAIYSASAAAQGFHIFSIMKGSVTTTRCGALGYAQIGSTEEGNQYEDNTTFDVSAIEDFYITTNTTAGTNFKVRWIAYLIKP